MALHRKYKVALLVAPVLIIIDQAGKTIIRDSLSPARVINIIPGYFQFRFAENPGMAFGLMQNISEPLRIPLFLGILVLALIIIQHLLRQAPEKSVKLPLALSMILAGAVGNFVDRLRWGAVVDFIRVQIWPPSSFYWPTFNLADAFIFMGTVLLIIDTMFSGSEEGGIAHELPAESEAEPPDPQEPVLREAGHEAGAAAENQVPAHPR